MADNKSKEAFFKELDDLDNLSDSSNGSHNNSGIGFRALTNSTQPHSPAVRIGNITTAAVTTRSTTSGCVTTIAGLPRTLSAATSSPALRTPPRSEELDDKVTVIKETPPLGSSLDPKSRGMKEGKRSLSSEKARKKQDASFKIVPESLQIFKGLKFFFLPNNDIAPARRLRIQRVQEYGALWARSWEDHITHVIVDKDLLFDDVLRFLKLDRFPVNVALVNQDYPSDCIAFRSVLKTTQSRFMVKGYLGTSVEVKAEMLLPDNGSLSLKKPKRKGRASPTPSQSEDSSVETYLGPPSKDSRADGPCRETGNQPQSNSARDLLDEFIEDARAMGNLPLDLFDNEDIGDPGSEPSPDIDSKGLEQKRPHMDVGGTIPEWQKNFACMQKHDLRSATNNSNARTIEILQQMLNYYTQTADHWRTIAYRKAISALRKQEVKISTKTQALAIPGIGERLADKIEEIVCTDRLRRLENTNLTHEDCVLQLFLGIYSVGFAQASKWIAMGYRTLDDLRTKAALTKNQQIGVEHYEDFQQRVPRAEVEAHGAMVRNAVHQVDQNMQVIIAGSYRRGAADSGDIDLLITKPRTALGEIRTVMMGAVVPCLFQQGFLQTGLATSSRGDGSKWHGASALPPSNVWRRIDLLFVPGEEIGAAMIYFTGNDIFNRSMRLLARKRGMCLNQHGLYMDVLRGHDQTKISRGTLVEGGDEKRIFEILGVPWRPPEHRIC